MWAALFLAVTQILLLVVLVLANSVEGGVIAYQVGFTFFLLPHALFALPRAHRLVPDAVAPVGCQRMDDFSRSIERGTRAIAFFVLPAAAGLTALAALLAHSILFGQTGRAGATQVAGVLVGFAPGLLGYGMFLFLSRVMYARHDTRTPALVNVGVALCGATAMLVAFNTVHGTLRGPCPRSGPFDRVQRRRRRPLPAGAGAPAVGERPRVLRSIAAPAGAAAIAGAAMWGIAHAVAPVTRVGSLAVWPRRVLVGSALYLGATTLLGGPRPRTVVAMLRRRPA